MKIGKAESIPHWWQLPFAMAMCLNAVWFRRCQVCGVGLCDIHADEQLPKRCHDHWFNRLQFVCHACHQRIDWQASQFSFHVDCVNQATIISGKSSVYYDYPYQQIIRQFKNYHQLSALLPLVHAIRQLDIPTGCHSQNSVIVAVPTTLNRLKQRGFDPVTFLSQYLSFHWQIPLFRHIEREERQHQQGLSRAERLENVSKAFYFTQFPPVKNVILFDDVVTTGATLQALAENLLSSSHNHYQVYACSVAHGKSF